MSEFMILVIVFISMLVLFYFLWVNGYMILNAKRALLFVVSLRGKNKCEVSFSSCSGYVKKVIKPVIYLPFRSRFLCTFAASG